MTRFWRLIVVAGLVLVACGGRTDDASLNGTAAYGGQHGSSGGVATTSVGGNGMVGPGRQSTGGTARPLLTISPFDPTLPTWPCGNGVHDGTEPCDDGNRVSGDGCDTTYQLEDPNPCGHGLCPTAVVCGDGVLAPGEICDDGTNSGQYASCGGNGHWGAYCGDGGTNGSEACDMGENNAVWFKTLYDGCLDTCTLGPYCGDGIVQGNEWCDEGEYNGTQWSYCTHSCVPILP